jgi:Peptidase family M28
VTTPTLALPSAQQILSTVEDLVALAPRATGTPGGKAAADYVAQRFRDAGLADVGFETVTSYAWEAREHRLSVGEVELECGPIRHCLLPTHDTVGELRGETGPVEVVDVGDRGVAGTDVRGKVVLFDLVFSMRMASLLPLTEYVHDPGRRMLRRDVLGSRNPYITSLCKVMTQAHAAGAVAVIGVLRDYPESTAYHNEYYRRTVLPLPGLWITRRTGEQLRAALAADDGRASVTVAAVRREVTARSVVGVLPGRTTETVMVQSHHDSVGAGAVEDGTGTAEVIALAEHYAARARAGEQREKTLMFVTFDTHFTGYQAHMAFAEKYVLRQETPYRIVLNATVEHVGLRAVRADDGSFEVTADVEPRAFMEDLAPGLKWQLARAIRKHQMTATTLTNIAPLALLRTGIPTDASFTFVAGVPTASLISGPLYLYDDCDTLDKVAVDQLVPVARVFVDLLDAADPRPAGRMGLVPPRVRALLPRGRW